ncbi:MAG: sirohydrochlorin cobaltochelatase [Prevotella sp.]|nr:sirohydrochlorin cobaltochelatase [Prevotella sp.]
MCIIILSLLVFLCATSCRAQETFSKQGLLMVHFGTTYDDTRQKTIDAINEKAHEAFPQLTLREAYTSHIVMKRLAKRGISKDTPVDALLKMHGEGVRTVAVQPSYVIDGIEMERLRQDVEKVRPFFDSIWVSTPLLYSVEDAEKVCQVLVNRHPADSRKHEHVLFIGHGTEGPATALYSQLDYMLRANGHANYHVSTIEGYPTQETTVAQIKAMKGRKVTLVPLLFVAGDHANNDIAVEWKEALEKQGFTVEVSLEGLGEVPEIQDLYIKKIKQR